MDTSSLKFIFVVSHEIQCMLRSLGLMVGSGDSVWVRQIYLTPVWLEQGQKCSQDIAGKGTKKGKGSWAREKKDGGKEEQGNKAKGDCWHKNKMDINWSQTGIA